MNGDNVGRVEGENRDLGSDRESFRNDLDIDKNPDTEDYAQEYYDESGEQMEVNPPREREVGDIEKDAGLEEKREKRRKISRRVGSAALLGTMLSQAGGSAVATPNVQREREKKEDNIAPVREQYHEDITKESTGEKQEFDFLDSSIGSGLDSEGLAKESVETEGKDVVQEIKDIIDITKWEGYKLESVEEIEPKYFVPQADGHNGSFLWVIPLHEDGLPNVDEQILKYQLPSAFSNSLQIGRLVNISTPEGDKLTFGVPEMEQEKEFDVEFITLLEITTNEGKRVVFSSEGDSEKAEAISDMYKEEGAKLKGKYLYFHHADVVQNIYNSKLENYEDLLKIYDPEYYLLGERYDSKETVDFIELFNENSLTRKFSENYLQSNQPLYDMWKLSKHINTLALSRVNIMDTSETRKHFSQVIPSSLIYSLYLWYPELGIPLGAYGYYIDEEGSAIHSFNRQVLNTVNDPNFSGSVTITVPHRDYTEGVDFHNRVLVDDFQFELHGGNFALEDFELGDVILIKGEGEDAYTENSEYLIVLGKEGREDEGVVLALVQPDRYRQERLDVFAVNELNFFELLGVEPGERIYFLRGQ